MVVGVGGDDDDRHHLDEVVAKAPVAVGDDDDDDDDEDGDEIDDDAYAILGLDVGASADEVQRAYRQLVKKFHPDRAAAATNAYDKDRFHRITSAGSVLRDRYHRLLYDLQHGKRDVPEAEINEVVAELRERAANMVANMSETVTALRMIESSRGGVVILKALYGDLRHRGALDRPVASCIDVTIPVQCMVQGSELVDHSRTKIFLDGFFDPCPHAPDKQLYIRYMFQDVVHQICYADADEVRLPMRSHAVSRADIPDDGLHSTLKTFPVRRQALQRRERMLCRRRENRIRVIQLTGTMFIVLMGATAVVKNYRDPFLAALKRLLT
ncbi:J domain-containing protein [Plasmodiophora brassicae]|uniref:J domain-containing protein n=1 Tax=Plasmodiophora brassicae TaxID=37360 RepID=A0A0G4IWW1_PLABS|nr:hypothetical protein PBRA_007557 [Plasmodiophora brassicae]SPR02087.1 unnamed protein product [Plasmodiophora brassicae]